MIGNGLALLAERSRVYKANKASALEIAKKNAIDSVRAEEVQLHLLALELLNKGASKVAVAEAAGISRPTLYRWVEDADALSLVKAEDLSPEAQSEWKITGELKGSLDGYVATNGKQTLEFEVKYGRRMVLDPSKGASGTYVSQPDGTDWIFEKWESEHA